MLNTNRPLTPAVPAFAVLSNNAPLVVIDPYPLTRDTRPPDAAVDVDVPADRISSPPEPLSPDPTVTYTDPPDPAYDLPDPMNKPPELPKDASPVLKEIKPLTPLAPAFGVWRIRSPLVVLESPVEGTLDTVSLPPVPADIVPADNTSSPPAPVPIPDPTVT